MDQNSLAIADDMLELANVRELNTQKISPKREKN